MSFPPNKYNPYIIIDLIEEYEKNCIKSDLFRETFKSFNQFLASYKKYKPNSIVYRHNIRNESRKYHKLYN